MIEVKATDQFKKLKVKDKTINRIREQGEKFKVNQERLEILLGENEFEVAFVELVKKPKKAEQTNDKD